MSEIQIKEIVIQLNEKELRLTIQDARLLKLALDNLLTPATYTYIPPVTIERPISPYRSQWIDCSGNSEIAYSGDSASVRLPEPLLE